MDNMELTATISDPLFFNILEASPRKVREVLYSKFGVKSKTKSGVRSLSARRQERAKKLHDELKASKGGNEEELCSELIRNWLFTKRPMLKSALDFVGIENDNGIVEQDLDKLENLKKGEVAELIAHLEKDFPSEEVKVYLQYVKVPHVI